MTWFGGKYKDDRSQNFFAQMATDPDEYMKVAPDKIVPPDQLRRGSAIAPARMVDVELAKKYGWKIGDKITLQGAYIPVEAGVDDAWDLHPRSGEIAPFITTINTSKSQLPF